MKKSVIGVLFLTLAGCAEPPLDCKINANIVDLATDASPIHDPAMIKAMDTYYLYSSSNIGTFYSSKDMRKWQREGEVFNAIPPWLVEEIPVADHIGAPDIAYYNGQYLLFYQSHNPNTCDAATGLTINKTLDPSDPNYEWVDQGLIPVSYTHLTLPTSDLV